MTAHLFDPAIASGQLPRDGAFELRALTESGLSDIEDDDAADRRAPVALLDEEGAALLADPSDFEDDLALRCDTLLPDELPCGLLHDDRRLVKG